MIGFLATARTFLGAFKGPCLAIALVGLIGGTAVGAWGMRKFDAAQILAAENKLLRLEKEQTQAIADAAAKNVLVSQDVLGGLYAQKQAISGLADDVRRLRGAVSVCASTSAMPVPGAPAAAAGEGWDDQPRAAVDVLQDLAAEFARRADENGARLNALIDWVEGVREPVGGDGGQR